MKVQSVGPFFLNNDLIFNFKNMEDLKILASSIAQISEEKGISYDTIIEVIEQALAAAYKKDNDRRGENIQAKLVNNPSISK